MKGQRKTLTRGLLTNALLFIFSATVVFLVCETSTRLIGKARGIDFTLYMKELKNSDRLPQELFMEDAVVGYRLRPANQVLATTSDFSVIYKTNSRGLRDKEYSYTRDEGRFRILAFGDSLLFGEGVSAGKRFADIPEERLPGIEVINFGVPGYGLDQQLLYFMTEGVKYSPDMAIVFIHHDAIRRYKTGISLNDTLEAKEMTLGRQWSPSTAYKERDDTFFKSDTAPLLKHSYFLSYLGYQLELKALKHRLEEHDTEIWEQIVEDQWKDYSEENSTKIEERSRRVMGIFNEIAKENGITLVVINIGIVGGLDSLVDAENIPYYDLSDELDTLGKEQPLRFTYDPHYNERTHEFIGERLSEILKGFQSG